MHKALDTSQSINAVLLNHHATRVKLPKEGEEISFADANVPELPANLGGSLSLLPDLGNQQNEPSVGIEPK